MNGSNHPEEILMELQLLRQEVIRLRQINADLEIAIDTVTIHGDTIAQQLQESYQKLEIEISERLRIEAALQGLLDVTTSDRNDLKTILELTAQHGDDIGRSLQSEIETFRDIANIDSLTQIPNRRRLDAYLQQEWSNLKRQRASIALLLCDIDYFKLYNDYYGHQAGDECLKKVAQAIAHSLQRPTDLVARYGGEEFAVVLPNTNAQGGIHVAQLIHKAIADLKILHLSAPINEYVTLSIGISATVPMQLSPLDFVNNADNALYQAKKQGRNCFVFKSYNI
jgi:diguanylate cyclase (GGDEF)-like protein